MHVIKPVALLVLTLICAGCVTTQAYLKPDLVQALNSKSVSVIYVDAAKPVTVLRYAELGAINKMASANDFEGHLAQHADDIAKFDVIDRNYQGMQAALSSIPSFKQAKWQRVSEADADSSMSDLAKQAGTDVVVVVQPQVMIYANVDTLTIRSTVSLYEESRYHSAVSRVAVNVMDTTAALGPDGSDSLPNPMIHNQYLVKGPELEQRVAALFADDGAEFQQAYGQALGQLKPQFTAYFTGTKAE